MSCSWVTVLVRYISLMRFISSGDRLIRALMLAEVLSEYPAALAASWMEVKRVRLSNSAIWFVVSFWLDCFAGVFLAILI